MRKLQKPIFLYSLLLIISGCAMTHPGIRGTSNKKDSQLVVSVDENTTLSDDFYGFFEYTFENLSEKWKRIKVTNVGFPDFENHIPVNNDLSAWIEGAELKFKKSRHNMGLLLGSVLAVGGVVAGTSDNKTTQAVGGGAAIAAAGTAMAVGVSDSMIALNAGQKGLHGTVNVPKTHVLVPFSVAPKSFVRRWIVLKTPKQENNLKTKKGNELLIGLQDGEEKPEYSFEIRKPLIRKPLKRFKRRGTKKGVDGKPQ